MPSEDSIHYESLGDADGAYYTEGPEEEGISIVEIAGGISAIGWLWGWTIAYILNNLPAFYEQAQTSGKVATVAAIVNLCCIGLLAKKN